MRIIILVPDMTMGGVTTIVRNLDQGIKEYSFKAKIVSLKREDNVENLCMTNKFSIFKALIIFWKISKSFKPDIIHSHTIFSHIIALLYKFIFNKSVKVICTEHGSLENKNKNKLVFILFRLLSKMANKIVFVSKFSLSSYVSNKIVSQFNSMVIYNGIGIYEANTIEKNKFKNKEGVNFCYIGRFSPEKNLTLLLEAYKILIEKNEKDINLTLIGDGEQREQLKEYCRQNRLDKINFLGFRSDVHDILKTMDCLVLSSFTEGLPTVVLEAYLQRTLVVSTNCGGVSEIIIDKDFISFDFLEESLADRMSYVLNLDYSTRCRIQEENYNFVLDNFSLEKMIISYVQLYKEVL